MRDAKYFEINFRMLQKVATDNNKIVIMIRHRYAVPKKQFKVFLANY